MTFSLSDLIGDEDLVVSFEPDDRPDVRADGPGEEQEQLGMSPVDIDSQMSWEDGVSLVFLLVHNLELAVEICKVMEKSKANKVVANAQDGRAPGIVEVVMLNGENTGKGKAAVVCEALYVIGHHRLLYDIGYRPEVSVRRFGGAKHLDRRKLVLQSFCQQVLAKEQDELTRMLLGSRQDRPTFLMMETQLLDALFCRILSLDDFSQLAMHAAQLNCSELVAVLRGPYTPNHPVIEPESPGGQNQPKRYASGPGLVFILNQKMFQPGTELSDRLGTDMDKEALTATFTLFGAHFCFEENLTHDQIMPRLKEAVRFFDENSDRFCYLVVAILSHGNEKDILGVDGVGVSRDDIIDMATNSARFPGLAMKPKMILLQACRGTQSPTARPPPASARGDVHGDKNSGGMCAQLPGDVRADVANSQSSGPGHEGTYPHKGDFVVVSSTIDKYLSYRSETTGSFLIQHLCNKLQERGHEDNFSAIMTSINYEVSRRPSHAVMFIYQSSLTMDLVFTRYNVPEALSTIITQKLYHTFMAEYIERKSQQINVPG